MATALENLKATLAAQGLQSRFVGSRGPKSSVVLVGEAPGQLEEAEGKPFVGPSGREQDKMLREAGLDEYSVYYTNVFKIRPPDNDLLRLGELGIPDLAKLSEAALCEELEQFKPPIIIAAGATALASLVPSCTVVNKKGEAYTPIGRWKGSLLRSPKLSFEHYVVPVQHPAFILREWSERQVAVFCYARAAEELTYWQSHGALQPLPVREIVTQPPFGYLHEFLHNVVSRRLRVSVDIELLKRRLIYAIGIADSPSHAVSFIPFRDYDVEQAVQIYKLLRIILRSNRQIGQNYLSFDSLWLSLIGLEPCADLVDDLMILHHVLYPEFSHKLQFMVMQFTREPYFKEEGHQWKPKDGVNRLLLYNGKDTATTYEVMIRMEEQAGIASSVD